MTFYNMMILEGFIAMVWAAATMAMIGLGAGKAGITMQFTAGTWQYFQNVGGSLQAISPTSVVGVICKKALGQAGGIIAIFGAMVLPHHNGRYRPSIPSSDPVRGASYQTGFQSEKTWACSPALCSCILHSDLCQAVTRRL